MSSPGVGLSWFWWGIYLSILLVFSVAMSSCGLVVRTATVEPAQEVNITIKVVSATPGVEITTASAKIHGSADVDTLEDGLLLLPSCLKPKHISVWSPGYYIHTFPCTGELIYNAVLRPLEAGDNTNYSWVGANFPTDSQQTCGSCHSDAQGRGETSEWMKDGHSRVFVNPYFRTIYTGTDIFQNLEPDSNTTWKILENGQKMRLPNDSPYGAGFRLDYPRDAGNCAFCHAPAAVTGSNQQADLTVPINNSSSGTHVSVETEGVTCDVCHKVVDVLVGEDQRPFIEKPGILSFFFTRPEFGKLFYIGPLADHKPSTLMDSNQSEDMGVCSPVFSESRFCAACHYGKFFDTLIYNSYGEWLQSGYSQKVVPNTVGAEQKENMNYRSCQDCHMPSAQPIGDSLQKERAACSEANHSFNNFNHNMMGRDQNNEPTLVKDAAQMSVDAIIEEGKIKVTVQVLNTRAGHKFPTDSPLRHLILVVEAKDRNGTSLPQVDGPVIPLWGGMGNEPVDYAGQPGEIYANILKDKDTSEAPTVAYWNPTIPAWEGSDTRLVPGVIVQSDYSFAIPSNGSASISAKLIYRYAFINIIRQKKWPLKDYIVTQLPAPIRVP